MAWDIRGISKLGPQSVHELHLLNVYDDPDFNEDVIRLYPKRLWSYVERSDNKEKFRYEKFHNELSSHPYEYDHKLIRQMNPNKITEIAMHYAITPEEVTDYLYGNGHMGSIKRPEGTYFTISKDNDDNFIIRFNSEITKEDFMQIWKHVASYKKVKHADRIPKNKLPIYDKLLYAIFKARQQGLSFGKIFELYSKCELPYFLKIVRGINSEEKLKDYYYKFYTKS